ncbi:MAG TPA: biotin--[acetyl-CoA-carboxylase] ligase [Candidatus Lambdaproteobacteria bacterium]|nr:biotin--[acetyl-CoA-carboxylase] ligase [Candidatus Lambdaproteobacteria bacterium]HIO61951.1 biotin--[acetyl-CoA-carboxylase] ligase [Deltaproteobacteria bacterium]HIO84690.1 biotin--[acetyl-CoA-carboxylase] ligase [Deltaproteobacteria bacterium]
MAEKIGNKIIRLTEVGSTNTYLKENCDLLKQHGLVVLAEMQTSGRGRAGRKFVSLPAKNITFSVVLHPNLPLAEVQVFALMAGVVVARVLETYVDQIRLKWPNDVMVRGKKICGILLETITITEQHFPVLILGIGLNTKGFLIDYPKELQTVITTLEAEILRSSNAISESEAASYLENETVFQQLLKQLECCLEEFSYDAATTLRSENIIDGRTALLQEWLKRSQAIGRKVRSLNNVEELTKGSGTVGIIEGLTKEGYLRIRTESGQILSHISGDILEIKEEK